MVSAEPNEESVLEGAGRGVPPRVRGRDLDPELKPSGSSASRPLPAGPRPARRWSFRTLGLTVRSRAVSAWIFCRSSAMPVRASSAQTMWPTPSITVDLLTKRISRCLYAHSVTCLFLWPEGSPLTELLGSTLTETVAQIQLNKNVRSSPISVNVLAAGSGK